MNEGQEALWSAPEVRTQAAQCPGQVDIWEAVEDAQRVCALCEGGGVVPSASGWTDVPCLHEITFTDSHRNVVTWNLQRGTLTERRRGLLVDDVRFATDLRVGGMPTFFHGRGGSWSFSPIVGMT